MVSLSENITGLIFTIGQKGLNLGGFKEPLFVIDTDIQKNIIYVGEGKSHPGLYRALEVSKIKYIGFVMIYNYLQEKN